MSTPRSFARFAILSAVGIIACAPPGDPPRAHWTDVTDSTEVRLIRESESLCGDCITVERVLVMGDTIGDGYLQGAFHLVRDSAGNYWFGQYEAVKVFDATGSFVGEVGRAGEGPLEWQNAKPVLTDRQGRVHVLDSGNGRHSIVGSDFALIEDESIPAYFNDARPLGDGERWVLNMQHPAPDARDLPLHILQGAEITGSFGGTIVLANDRSASTQFQRIITTDSANRIFSAPWYRSYEIEVWNDAGRRITGFLEPEFNDPPRDPEAPQSADNPPASTIRALRVDLEDRLWVLSWQLRDDWLDMMEERRGPDGRVTLEMKPDLETMDRFDGQIDVIDLTTATVIARTRIEGVVLVDFLGEDELWSGDFFGPGHLRAGIWEIGFTP